MTRNTKLDRGPGRAVYQQIADYYRHAIVTGEFSPGAKLPSVSTLSEQWGVSHQTVQNAIKVLRGEKLVATDPRRGVYVREDAATSESGQNLIKNHTGAPQGDEVRVLSAEIVTCPAYVGDLLGIDADAGNARVCRREAVAYRNGRPYRLSVSWTAPWAYGAATELTEPRLVNGLRAIRKATGRGATQGRDYFQARVADEREAGHLDIAEGEVILAGTSVWSDEKGPVEYREFVVNSGEVVDVAYPVDLGPEED